MPRPTSKSVRNFWIEVIIDGKKEVLKIGPKSKDGGFSLAVYQREDNEIIKAAQITGIAAAEHLHLTITSGVSTKR